MIQTETVDLDETGKLILDQIYNRNRPIPYYSTLLPLKYCIPQVAKPVFRKVIDEYRRVHGRRRLKIVDVGCSYGVNAALLKHGKDLPALYAHYAGRQAAKLDRAGLIARDGDFYGGADADEALEFVGVDTAERAVAYAVEAGILDEGVCVDLEREEPSADERALLAGADLVISTGCVGYVGENTFRRILDSNEGRGPWFANFVLRMFSFEPLRALFATRSYRTERAGGQPFPQRRFASREERERVRRRLNGLGVGVGEMERRGWLAAEFFLTRPAADCRLAPLTGMMPAR